MNVLDLFSGIGGFSLGLERAGMRTVAFCEIDPYCRAVLKKHWPHVRCFEDIRDLTAERLAATAATGDIGIDVIAGGFPCEDISVAGKGIGIEGGRSGLWSEFARLVGEVRPRYVVVENVAALLGRGLGRVLGDLAALGFDAEWHCIPASAIGARHIRDRVWILAYPSCKRRGEPPQEPIFSRWATVELRPWWGVEPDVGRVAYGVPDQVDRGRAIGKSLVPQIPEIIGKAIMQAERAAPHR